MRSGALFSLSSSSLSFPLALVRSDHTTAELSQAGRQERAAEETIGEAAAAGNNGGGHVMQLSSPFHAEMNTFHFI